MSYGMSYDQSKEKSTTFWVFLLGCGGLAAVGLLVMGLACVWVMYIAEDPEGVVVSVEGPDTVVEGEEFSLTVVVKNERATESIDLTDIDIAEEYLEGFLILGSEPAADSTTHIPIDDTRSFTFNTSIPPQTTMEFEFQLRPVSTGLFRGDIDVCEGQRFLSTFAQTLVESDESAD